MIKHKYFIVFVFSVFVAISVMGQQQGLVHPWMLFNNNDISTIKTKLSLPANAKLYQNLKSGTGLKYILYGDLIDLAAVKTKCFYSVLGARASMLSTNTVTSPFQWGRRMQDWIVPLSLVINNTSSPYTAAEIARLRLSCDSIAWRLRDATYSEVGPGGGPNNRTLDEIMGVAYAGVFMFPDNPNAADHYAYVMRELQRHLNYVGSDGTWPETSRYVGQVVVKCLLLFARVQKNYLGNDTGLISNPKFKSVIKGLMLTAHPKDILNGNLRDAPAIGDAGWGETNLSLMAWAAAELSSYDPALSKVLMGIWKMAGANYNNGGNCFSYQLAVADAEAQADTSYVLPSVIQKNIGYYIFRNNYGTPSESYLITHLPEGNTYHRHADCGSFSFFAKNTPLMLDAGVGEYAEPDNTYFKSTLNHNVVSFKDVNGLDVNGMEVQAKVLDSLLSADYDFVSANITPPNSIANKYVRSTGYLKTLFNSIVIFDYVDSNIGRLHANNLHTFSTSTDQQISNGFLQTVSHAYNGLDIEMNHLLPSTGITLSKMKFNVANIPKAWPRNLADRNDVNDLDNCYQESLAVTNSGKNHYLTVIRPKEKSELASEITSLSVDNINCKGFKVNLPGKGSYVILINTSTVAQTTLVQMDTNDNNLISMRSKIKYTMDSFGKYSLSIPAMSMDVFLSNDLLSASNPIEIQHAVKISPSMSKGVYKMEGDCLGACYSVINLTGQSVLSGKIVQTQQFIDITNHPQGTYLVQISKEGRTEMKKIIKL